MKLFSDRLRSTLSTTYNGGHSAVWETKYLVKK